MAYKTAAPTSLVCHNCRAKNPPKAYCCLSCFKVLRPKEKIPFWKIHVRPDGPMIVFLLVLGAVSIYTVRRWIQNIEAEISMNFRSAEYNLTVTADKRKKQSLLGKLGFSIADAKTENEQPSDSLQAPEK